MVWKVEVQPRTRVFLWRATRNIFPTRSRLASKGVDVGNDYYLCGANDESVFYLLFGCPYTKEVMEALDVQLSIPQEPGDALSWIRLVQDTFSSLQDCQRSLVGIA